MMIFLVDPLEWLSSLKNGFLMPLEGLARLAYSGVPLSGAVVISLWKSNSAMSTKI